MIHEEIVYGSIGIKVGLTIFKFSVMDL